MRSVGILFSCISLSIILGCSHEAELHFSAGVGPNPVLPPPPNKVIPTVNVAKAKGWPNGVTPMAA